METTERNEPQVVSVGSAFLTIPETWSLSSRSENEVVLRSAGGRKQATIGMLRFKRLLSFEEFGSVCAQRVEVEKKALKEGFIHPDRQQYGGSRV